MLSCFTCLVPYVLSCLTCLVSYVFSCLTYLVLYVLSCLTCSRDLRGSCPTCSRVSSASRLKSLLPYISRVQHVSYQTCFRVSRVLLVVHHVSRALLLPWGCSCLELYVLLCSFSLTCFRCFTPNILFCISGIEEFMPCVSCTFVALAIWVFYSLG